MTPNAMQTPIEKNNAPLISVVLPVYNGEKYLAESIDSILSQSFTSFELIMIDDGSTDHSPQILRKYEQSDPRVRVVVRENRGLATTLNDSIDMARGTWIARMDQDDISLSYRFEHQLAWLNETGADISGSWVRRFGSSDKRVVRLRQTDEAIKMEMLFCSPFAHPTVMMRTSLVKKLRYNKACEKVEDYDLWERAAEGDWQMTNVPEVLLMYRVHGAQISTSNSDRQFTLGQQIQYRYWAYLFSRLQINQGWIKPALDIYLPAARQPDMNIIDATFIALLRQSHGEARDVIWDHLARLYLRVAADCQDVISRWKKLNKDYSGPQDLTTKFMLLVLHWMRIRPEHNLYILLKKLHGSWIRGN